MQSLVKRAGSALLGLFEACWHYLGSLAAVCLLAAALGLGIYHMLIPDSAPTCYCYAGVHNTAGAEPPDGVLALGRNVSPGVPHVRLEHDAQGRVRHMKSVNAHGRLCALPGSRVAEQRLEYDAAGRLVRKENRDADGSLAEDAQGVASRDFERDAAGRVVRTVFRNAAGRLTAPRFPGYAERQAEYDPQGRLVRVVHLGADGTPTRNASGEELVEYRYGADGSVTRSNYVGGELADDYDGVAQEEWRTSALGSTRSWKNAAGAAVINPAVGAAELHHDHASQGGVERRLFMDAAGAPNEYTRACAEHLVRCNSDGQPEWEFYGGANGLPVNHPALGYAERLCQYSPEGHLEREYFWDAQGRPAAISERRHVDTHAGAYTLSLHSDGSTVVQPE